VGRKLASGVRRLGSFVNSQRFGVSPSRIYGDDFYEHHVGHHQEPSAAAVAETLIELFHPACTFDVGCGSGIYSRELAARSVQAFGCDGSEHAIKRVPPTVFCVQHDLKEPLTTNRRFDLCFCFEVAEHIPKRFSENLVASCAGLSDTVVFSSATPGQGGTDHINEQPDSYWDALFAQNGLAPDPETTARLRERFRARDVIHWLTSNTRVYHRRNG
jgi:2-polyprenyl-3-methyl-5-hydroxy-6-metoxy-1,4-benzoquinol methylase